MEIKPNEVLFIYNSQDLQQREAYGYVQTLKDHKVKPLDVTKEILNERQLAELVDRMDVKALDLIREEEESLREKSSSMDMEEVLTVIRQNPTSLKTPIAVYDDKAHFVDSAYNFINRDMKVRNGAAEDSANKREQSGNK